MLSPYSHLIQMKSLEHWNKRSRLKLKCDARGWGGHTEWSGRRRGQPNNTTRWSGLVGGRRRGTTSCFILPCWRHSWPQREAARSPRQKQRGSPHPGGRSLFCQSGSGAWAHIRSHSSWLWCYCKCTGSQNPLLLFYWTRILLYLHLWWGLRLLSRYGSLRGPG